VYDANFHAELAERSYGRALALARKDPRVLAYAAELAPAAKQLQLLREYLSVEKDQQCLTAIRARAELLVVEHAKGRRVLSAAEPGRSEGLGLEAVRNSLRAIPMPVFVCALTEASR
jgi:hypothetical protein